MTLAYVIGLIIVLPVFNLLKPMGAITAMAIADVVGTVVIFIFSRIFNNSSFYDPYWSVAPPFIAVGFFAFNTGDALSLRQIIVFSLVMFWAVRLTFNFLRTFKNIAHQDWRYDDLQAKTGRFYWLVSFLGIHLFPTILVFLGCLSFYFIFGEEARPFNLVDFLALVLTTIAIIVETVADEQLTRFKKTNQVKGKTLQSGIWAYSRHPNYFGEILFWWGLFAFSFAANPQWWPIVGAVSITFLFQFISIPMIEKRMMTRRQDYLSYSKRVAVLFPWFPKPEPKKHR